MMKRNYKNLYIGLIVFAVVVLALYFTGVFSFLGLKNSVTFGGETWSCNPSSTTEANAFTKQRCELCVLENAPTFSPRNSLGECVIYTASDGKQRYRYYTTPQSKSGLTQEEYITEFNVYQSQLSSKYDYCPVNTASVLNIEQLGACAVVTSNQDTPIAQETTNDTQSDSSNDVHTTQYVNHMPTWAWILVIVALVIAIWALFSKK